jgi:hypothetical protein
MLSNTLAKLWGGDTFKQAIIAMKALAEYD